MLIVAVYIFLFLPSTFFYYLHFWCFSHIFLKCFCWLPRLCSSVSMNLLVCYVPLDGRISFKKIKFVSHLSTVRPLCSIVKWVKEHRTMHAEWFNFLENKYFVLAIYVWKDMRSYIIKYLLSFFWEWLEFWWLQFFRLFPHYFMNWFFYVYFYFLFCMCY